MKNLADRTFIKKFRDFFRSERNKHFFVKGKNNKVLVANLKRAGKIYLHIYGDNNEIIVNTQKRFVADIHIGSDLCRANNCKIIIGEDSIAEDIIIRMLEDDLELSIGKDCMLSSDIQIFCSDIHTIYDTNNQPINRGSKIEIGNHVWVGMGAYIAKKSVIADNCIIGMKSLVAGKFAEPNCVIAGNPARVVKQNVNWDRRPIKHFAVTDRKIAR